MPADVSNGLTITLLKNAQRATPQTVHVVGPGPSLVQLELFTNGEDEFTVVGVHKKPERCIAKPRVGALLGTAATSSEHVRSTIASDSGAAATSAFLAFEAPLYMEGPVWCVELLAPTWPQNRAAGGGGCEALRPELSRWIWPPRTRR